MRTRGKVGYAYCAEKGTDIISANAGSKIIAHCADGDDGYFIASVFNTAHALDEAGYDGEKAIRELPELVEAMGATMTDITDPAYKYGDVLTFANRIREINALMQVALDKIRGDK